MKDYKIVKTMHEHTCLVASLINVSNNRLASGSKDTKVKIYDSSDDFKCIRTLELTNRAIGMLYLDKENTLICLCSWDLSVWDIDTGNCLRILDEKKSFSALLLLSDGYFASSSTKDGIKIWNSDGFECINTFGLEYDERIYKFLLLKDYRIISGSYNGRIIKYNY
jgi:WD40 repeat protein